MIVYEFIQGLRASGVWDVLRENTLVNPQTVRQMEIYERVCSYLGDGNNITDSVVWVADEYYTAESWVWKIYRRFSTKIPEPIRESV